MLVVAAHDELSVRITLLRSLYCLHPPQESQDPPLPELGLSGFEFLRARRPLAVVLLVGRLVVFELLSVRPAGQVRIVELVLSDIFTRLVGV
jgi:hypothetical protein